MRRGYANLPLHTGRAPAWLFQRMTKLAGTMAEIMVIELGAEGFLQRIADPFWFQCLGCVLGFDWHSSGLTTTTCGALKEGIRGREMDLGLFIGGGKGSASRKTPEEIQRFSERAGTDADRLVYASRMSAKVDSAAVQNGFQVYHHCFFFTRDGQWAVVQQGMNEASGWARRYHWMSDPGLDFVCEPHKAVCSDARTDGLNMVARESVASREAATQVSRLTADEVIRQLRIIRADEERLDLPGRHDIRASDINPDRLKDTFARTYERQPENFEALLGLPGVGPKTVRALSLVGALVHGAQPSFRDPARFSFAHGGKDGIPFPVDRKTYDTTVVVLEKAVAASKLGSSEKLASLRRMATFLSTDPSPR